jgi:hypothetical protein
LIRPEECRVPWVGTVPSIASEGRTFGREEFREEGYTEEETDTIKGSCLWAGDVWESSDHVHQTMVPFAERTRKLLGDFLHVDAPADSLEE